MDHILQFAIGIDDDAIKKRIEESAVEKVSNELSRSVKERLFSDSVWASGFTETGEDIVKSILYEYKDEIIEQAVKLVVESIKRTKKFRESVGDIVEDYK